MPAMQTRRTWIQHFNIKIDVLQKSFKPGSNISISISMFAEKVQTWMTSRWVWQGRASLVLLTVDVAGGRTLNNCKYDLRFKFAKSEEVKESSLH